MNIFQIVVDNGADYPDDGEDRYQTILLTDDDAAITKIEVHHDDMWRSQRLTRDILAALQAVPESLRNQAFNDLIESVESLLEDFESGQHEDYVPTKQPVPTDARISYGVFGGPTPAGTSVSAALDASGFKELVIAGGAKPYLSKMMLDTDGAPVYETDAETGDQFITYRRPKPIEQDITLEPGDRVEYYRRMKEKGT